MLEICEKLSNIVQDEIVQVEIKNDIAKDLQLSKNEVKDLQKNLQEIRNLPTSKSETKKQEEALNLLLTYKVEIKNDIPKDLQLSKNEVKGTKKFTRN